MAQKAWEERIDEMIRALRWFDNEYGGEPTKCVKGRGMKWFEAKLDGEMAKGVNEFDAIRNLWQKMGCPVS